MAKALPAVEFVPLDGPFSIPLDALPFLEVFGLPFDSEGDIQVFLTMTLPTGDTSAASVKPIEGNRSLATIKRTPGTIEIATLKIWRLGALKGPRRARRRAA